jgi:hypothetical protein
LKNGRRTGTESHSAKVYEVLCQLQLETHYLMTKILVDWDDYDHSNFKALCRKAGTPEPLYAVFESSIQEEDKYISVPLSKYYSTQWEAESKNRFLFRKNSSRNTSSKS